MALAGCVLSVAVAGCSQIPAMQPAAQAPGPAPSPAELASRLELREQALATFRGQAGVEFRGKGGRLRASQMILVRSPDSVRVDVLHPFGVAYTLVADGGTLAALDHREKVHYRGRATTENVRRFTGLALAPAALAPLLRGLPPALAVSSAGHVSWSGRAWVWRRPLARGGSYELAFGADTLEPLAIKLPPSSVLGSFERVFGDYRMVDAVRVPHRIDITLGAGGEIGLEYERIWRGVTIGDGAFRVSPTSATRTVDLDALAQTQ